MTRGQARIREHAAAEVAAHGAPPDSEQYAAVALIAPAVAQAASKTHDAAGKPAA